MPEGLQSLQGRKLAAQICDRNLMEVDGMQHIFQVVFSHVKQCNIDRQFLAEQIAAYSVKGGSGPHAQQT